MISKFTKFFFTGLFANTQSTVNFDETYNVVPIGNIANFYSNTHGVSFAGGFLVGGIGNGDPGNWGIEGTNGSAFRSYVSAFPKKNQNKTPGVYRTVLQSFIFLPIDL